MFLFLSPHAAQYQVDFENLTKEAEALRRQQLRKQYNLRKKRGVIGSPPPVKGRRHETVQTERYLEELLAHPLERSAECQTDLYLNAVPEPPYIQTKSGVDASTLIGEGDLFDFDVEVEPILDSLINQTAKCALDEVLEEEQLAALQREKERYLAVREAELAELRKLEANEIRSISEKKRRERYQQIANDLETEMQEHMSAAKLLEGYVANLLPDILTRIQTEIATKNANELENVFLPWLSREVAREVGEMVDARDILEEIVGQIMREQATDYERFKAETNFDIQADGDGGSTPRPAWMPIQEPIVTVTSETEVHDNEIRADEDDESTAKSNPNGTSAEADVDPS